MIMPERLLNDDSAPASAFFLALLRQISLAQLLHDLAKECRWCREIEEIVALRAPLQVTLLQHFGHLCIPGRVLKRRRHIVETLLETIPNRRVYVPYPV